MTDYIRIIGECFPESEAYVLGGDDPTVYENVVWVTTPIAQATLDESSCLNNETVITAVLDELTNDDFLRYNSTTGKWNNQQFDCSEGVTFGSNFQYAENNTTSSTTSTNWIQKLRMTTSSLESGTYRIGWSASVKSNRTSNLAQCRVQINDTTTIATVEEEPHDAKNWMPRSGFKYYTGSGVLNIDIDYSSTKSNATTSIRNARLEIWRVS